MKRHKSVWIGMAAILLLIGLAGCDIIGDLLNGNDEDGPISISSISPSTGLMNQIVTISISGNPLSADMSPNLRAKLINGPTIIEGTSINVITGGQITATFNLSVAEPMTMDVYLVDEEGDEGTLAGAFTVDEYDVVEGPVTGVTMDLSGGDLSYDFSLNAGCVTTSSARDVTFTVDTTTGTPAITITNGGSGGILLYQPAFGSLSAASDLQSNPDNYARAGSTNFPFVLAEGEYYGLINVSEPDQFVVMKITGVDSVADSAVIDFMIVHLIETGL